MSRCCLKYGLLLFSFLLLCGAALYYNTRILEVTHQLRLNKWETIKQQSDIERTKAEIRKLITEDSLATQIIFANKIENLNLLFELIRDDYELENYNFLVKNSIRVDTVKQSSFYDVILTDVTLSFTADSRMRLYMFLDEVISKIPGHVHIKSVAFTMIENVLYVVLDLGIYTLSVKNL
ncbi:hypothetical protein ACJZTR_03270 [Neorickettsia risticii]|uniref:Uncharacterized protein n=1 Tax=Neorickettsia risticii (strain Illinois) TaxID=434131 RepID=C6V5R0_NEORI|nr:hypothetical protein [Neorickettsia risticii]ACT69720.1 conserved hypothetical protein [Neorickettsia risticii str. Illinois]